MESNVTESSYTNLLMLDIDGVLTNGTKVYNLEGEVVGKSFNDLDYTAIRRLKSWGWHVVFISSDKRVNEKMAEKRKIPFYHSREPDGSINKEKYVKVLKKLHNIKEENMYYIGDDVVDINIMSALPKKNCFCPNTSPRIVKLYANELPSAPGQGVVAAFLDYHIPFNDQFKTGLWYV